MYVVEKLEAVLNVVHFAAAKVSKGQQVVELNQFN
jgi:hypothetical protein